MLTITIMENPHKLTVRRIEQSEVEDAMTSVAAPSNPSA